MVYYVFEKYEGAWDVVLSRTVRIQLMIVNWEGHFGAKWLLTYIHEHFA